MMKGGSGSGVGSGSIPLTGGSGSGRPKNKWIRWIRNTVRELLKFYLVGGGGPSEYCYFTHQQFGSKLQSISVPKRHGSHFCIIIFPIWGRQPEGGERREY